MSKQTKVLSISLSRRIEDRLEYFAEKIGKSRSAVVGDALRYYFLNEEFDLLQHDFFTKRGKIVNDTHRKKSKWAGYNTWEKILAKLNHLASQGKQEVNLADFVYHDRQAH